MSQLSKEFNNEKNNTTISTNAEVNYRYCMYYNFINDGKFSMYRSEQLQ